VADPKTLVRLGDKNDCCVGSGVRENEDYSIFATATWQYVKKNAPEFEELAAIQAGFEPRPITARRGGSQDAARSMVGEFVSGNYFRTFGLKPQAGRLFTDADDVQGAPMVRGGQHVLDQHQGGDDCGHCAAGLFWRSAVEHAAEFLSAD
jgi:macrolide transport system ATP-binding/permease protein